MTIVRRLRTYLAVLVALLSITSSLFLIRIVHNEETVDSKADWGPPAPKVATPLVIANNQTTITTAITADTVHPLDRIQVPFPIFVVSLPKSGTTTVARYFYCGKIWTANTFCNTNQPNGTHRPQMRIGHCILENMQQNRSNPLHDCGNYKVWTDLGHPRGTPCFYPSVHGLAYIAEYFPQATLLLTTRRNATTWAQSIRRWDSHNKILHKWRRCDLFPSDLSTDAELESFYEWHIRHVQDFVAAHPSLTLIQVNLEDDDAAEQMQAQIGVPAACLGHHNSHEKRMKLNPQFRKKFQEAQKEPAEEHYKT